MEFTIWWRDTYYTNRCKTAIMPSTRMESYLVLRASNGEVTEDSNVEVNFELTSEN